VFGSVIVLFGWKVWPPPTSLAADSYPQETQQHQFPQQTKEEPKKPEPAKKERPKPTSPKELGKNQHPPPSEHVVVQVEKGAKWISTNDTIYAPNGKAIENKGEITSKGMLVIAPQTSPIQTVKVATWSQEPANWQEKEGLVSETQLTLIVDRSIEIPAFYVKCDSPCKIREAVVLGAYNKLDYLTSSDPTISGAVFLPPVRSVLE
jgi:hypothetical protein